MDQLVTRLRFGGAFKRLGLTLLSRTVVTDTRHAEGWTTVGNKSDGSLHTMEAVVSRSVREASRRFASAMLEMIVDDLGFRRTVLAL